MKCEPAVEKSLAWVVDRDDEAHALLGWRVVAQVAIEIEQQLVGPAKCSRELTDLGLIFNSLNIKVVQSEVADARRRQSAAEAQANADIVAAQQARRAKEAQLEAERVISELLYHKFKHNTDFRDYAILFRENMQSRVFERVLRERRIPYYLSGGSSFFDKTEVKDIMAYLRVLANPADDSAFLRVVNTPRREIGTATLETLANADFRHGWVGRVFELLTNQRLALVNSVERTTHVEHHRVPAAVRSSSARRSGNGARTSDKHSGFLPGPS